MTVSLSPLQDVDSAILLTLSASCLADDADAAAFFSDVAAFDALVDADDAEAFAPPADAAALVSDFFAASAADSERVAPSLAVPASRLDAPALALTSAAVESISSLRLRAEANKR